MATTETRNIVVRYKADASGLRSTLRSMDSSLASSARSMAAVNAKLASFGNALKGVVSIAAVAQLGRQLQVFSDFADSILEISQRTGIATTAIQVMRLQAELFGASVQETDKALDFFNKKLGEAKVKGGEAALAFERFDINIDDDTTAVLDQVVKRLQNIKDPAEAAALAVQAFGRSGLQVAQAARNMEGPLSEVAGYLGAQGKLIDENTLRRAADFGDALTEIRQVIGALAAGPLSVVAGFVGDLGRAFLTSKANGDSFLATLRNIAMLRDARELGFSDAGARDLLAESERNRLLKEQAALLKDLQQTQSTIASGEVHPARLDTLVRDAEQAELRLQQINIQLKALASPAPTTRTIPDALADAAERAGEAISKLKGLDPQFAVNLQAIVNAASAKGIEIGITSGLRSTEQQAKLWADALVKYGSAEIARKWVAPPGSSLHEKGVAADLKTTAEGYKFLAENVERFGLSLPLANERWHVELEGVRDGGKRMAASIKDSNKEAAQSYEQLFSALDTYRALVESTLTPQERFNEQIAELNQLRAFFEQQGFSFDPTVYVRGVSEARAQFDAASEGLKNLDAEAETTKATMAELGAVFSSAFEDAIVNGGDLGDILKGLEKDIIRIITRMYVLQPLMKTLFGDSSGVGGLLSGLFGGGKALGGPVSAGTSYVVGERGPELFVPSSNGRIIPNNQLTVNVNVTGRGGGSEDRSSADQLAAAIGRQVQRAMARNL